MLPLPMLTLLVSCAGLLSLALLAAFRGGQSPLGPRLSLLCLDLFAWQAAQFAGRLTGADEWYLLNVFLSPLAVPLALDFTLEFAGRLRELHRARLLCWGAFGLLALVAGPLALLVPRLRAVGGSPPWSVAYLIGLCLVTVLLVVVLRGHQRQSPDRAERTRARLLLWALLLGALAGSTDLFSDVWPQLPSVAPLGLFASTAITAVVALRFQLFDRQLPLFAGLLALGLGCLGVLVHLRAFVLLGPQAGVLLLGSLSLALAVFAVTRSATAALAERRARLSQLAFLGRLSSQMAHDLKNPLAALKGAAQFIEEEEARSAAPGPKRRFTRLMIDQIERIERVVEQYQRLARVEPRPEPLSLNALVERVLALQPFAGGPVQLRCELASPLPPCEADPDLLGSALENLVRNACEAMPAGGTVTVRTQSSAGAVWLSVEDSGPGMDARTRERAFDDFFTTKAQGSGLGLSFVRRVAEAHAGEVELLPASPHGTVVRLRLPLLPPRAQPEVQT